MGFLWWENWFVLPQWCTKSLSPQVLYEANWSSKLHLRVTVQHWTGAFKKFRNSKKKKRQTAVQQAKISLQQSCTKALKKSYMIYLRLLNLYMCDPCYHYSADVNLASFFHMWQNCIFKWLLVAFCISKQVKLEMLETKPKNYLGCIWEGCSNQSEVSVKIAAWSLH